MVCADTMRRSVRSKMSSDTNDIGSAVAVYRGLVDKKIIRRLFPSYKRPVETYYIFFDKHN